MDSINNNCGHLGSLSMLLEAWAMTNNMKQAGAAVAVTRRDTLSTAV